MAYPIQHFLSDIGDATGSAKISAYAESNGYTQDTLLTCQFNQLADSLLYELNIKAATALVLLNLFSV